MRTFPWKAVAWDIDGTLVDSEPLHHRALVATCGEHGLDLSHLAETAFIGMHWAMSGRSFAAICRKRWPRRISMAGSIIITRPTRPAWSRSPALSKRSGLDTMGVAQVCASNSARMVVDANLAAIAVTSLIRGAISLDDVTEGKPAPEPYLRAARLIDTDPADILAVEDSLTGVRAACAAGMQVALLCPGADAPQAGPDAEPHFRISALDEILRLAR